MEATEATNLVRDCKGWVPPTSNGYERCSGSCSLSERMGRLGGVLDLGGVSDLALGAAFKPLVLFG